MRKTDDVEIASTKGVNPTIVEKITSDLREAIRQGIYSEGERIVVADVSENFGVSFGPVREAIRRLSGEGLLEFVPHRGATVKAFSETDIREMFQVREALEGYVARLAAENIHRGNFRERLKACMATIESTMGKASMEASTQVRQQFHDLLYEIAGNRRLEEEARRYTYPVQRLRFNKLMGPARERESLLEHRHITEAILAGDGGRAERLLRSHLRASAYLVCEVLDQLRSGVDVERE